MIRNCPVESLWERLYCIRSTTVGMIECIQIETIFWKFCHGASFFSQHFPEFFRGRRILGKLQRKSNHCNGLDFFVSCAMMVLLGHRCEIYLARGWMVMNVTTKAIRVAVKRGRCCREWICHEGRLQRKAENAE